MADSLKDKLLDIIQAVELADPDREFLDAAMILAALAISRLPPTERERTLAHIEDYGTLRRAVQKFPGARPSPYPRVMH